VLVRHMGFVWCAALWGSCSAVRFLVVQHVSVAGSGALRPGAGRAQWSVRALVRGIESGMKHESKDVYRVDVVPIGEAQPASS
jgi:hypothetical protein